MSWPQELRCRGAACGRRGSPLLRGDLRESRDESGGACCQRVKSMTSKYSLCNTEHCSSS